jgi:RNA polymerase sigma factor (TIGR02999 family)
MPGSESSNPEPPHPDAWSGLTDTLYAELREVAASMMRRERAEHTLQPTAVANEACLRLARRGMPELPREQQLAIAARVLGQVLIDHARRNAAEKRGGGTKALRVHLDQVVGSDGPADGQGVEYEAVHGAMERLRALHARQAEVVTLRVMGGLTVPQISGVLGVSVRTVESDWAVARAWLRRELGEPAAAEGDA